jgi:hypothetical protein
VAEDSTARPESEFTDQIDINHLYLTELSGGHPSTVLLLVYSSTGIKHQGAIKGVRK